MTTQTDDLKLPILPSFVCIVKNRSAAKIPMYIGKQNEPKMLVKPLCFITLKLQNKPKILRFQSNINGFLKNKAKSNPSLGFLRSWFFVPFYKTNPNPQNQQIRIH
jgi:hypothetical protein